MPRPVDPSKLGSKGMQLLLSDGVHRLSNPSRETINGSTVSLHSLPWRRRHGQHICHHRPYRSNNR